MNGRRLPVPARELELLTIYSDTRDTLARASRQAEAYDDCFLVDVDAHVGKCANSGA